MQDLNPCLLKVAETAKGKSLKSNKALVRQNAQVGKGIARTISELVAYWSAPSARTQKHD
jgi:pseudouridine-5'-phosphate glycosidase